MNCCRSLGCRVRHLLDCRIHGRRANHGGGGFTFMLDMGLAIRATG